MPRRADEKLEGEIARATGARLAEIRRERGLTQAALADLLGVGVVGVSRVEQGHVSLGTSALFRWCRALDVHPGCVVSALDDEREARERRLTCSSCGERMTEVDGGLATCDHYGRTVR